MVKLCRSLLFVKIYIPKYHRSGFSALHKASLLGFTDDCEVLIDYGADVNMRTTRGTRQFLFTYIYNTIQYNTIQYNTIQYNTIQYNTIQYNTIHNTPYTPYTSVGRGTS